MTHVPTHMEVQKLIAAGMDPAPAAALAQIVDRLCRDSTAAVAWHHLAQEHLRTDQPFAVHACIHGTVFADWSGEQGPPPAWLPSEPETANTNITALMRQVGCGSYDELHAWSTQQSERFWQLVLDRLPIVMSTPPHALRGTDGDPRRPAWLAGARLNIVSSCFQAPGDQTAIVQHGENGAVRAVTYDELQALTARVAHGLAAMGVLRGDAVTVCMSMTIEAVAVYLGIIAIGGVVVSIADSFAPGEIARRNTISGSTLVFTQDHLLRGGKQLPLYARVAEAGSPRAVVVTGDADEDTPRRNGDIDWEAFLARADAFIPVDADPGDTTNILFSSGTTGDPKAIPWTHLTPIRAATDAHFHHDIHAGDVLAWPTNLGWMMGPWLIYASLINRATMALYDGAPTTVDFARFVQDSGVTMLGLVPSLVRVWRESGCLDGCDWRRIKAFSSTGECSNADDMLFLMSRAGYRPVIEYCGGTEIGGGYITGTLVQPASPATFTTPALGTTITILDDAGQPADEGELFIVPPTLGLSETLLNRDHDTVYYANTPPGPGGCPLRRHGDQMHRLGGGFFRAQGRIDDTMNLGGIKISSAEIERVVSGLAGVHETAAVAVEPPDGGPSRLVLYIVAENSAGLGAAHFQRAAQRTIRSQLNPLFRVHDVVVIDALPRTASNKVMRRELRRAYAEPSS